MADNRCRIVRGDAMRSHPILFSGEMIRAILEGRKTQTRRIISPQPEFLQVYDFKGKRLYDGESRRWCWNGHVGDVMEDISTSLVPHSRIKVGDHLWVKETFAYFEPAPGLVCGASFGVSLEFTLYRADLESDEAEAIEWRPSIHMPQWASRITLEVTSVRAERLQDISWLDAIAEGIKDPKVAALRIDDEVGTVQKFRKLWDSIYSKKHPWDSNPWVWVYEFKVLEVNP